MTHKIEIKPSAQKELSKIPKNFAVKIIKKIKTLAEDPRPNGCKKLTGVDSAYRIRIGNYRVVYSIYDQQLIIEVVKIGHRKGIYK